MVMKDWVVPEEVFARGLNLGQKREGERIIKLLEGRRFLCSDKECCWLATEYACDCKEVIALIKDAK